MQASCGKDSGQELTDTEQQVEKLDRTQRAMNAGFSEALVVLKGSVEFRNAVEALLVGTPHEKPTDTVHDFEGLYGRLRNALRGRLHTQDVTRDDKLAAALVEQLHAAIQELRTVGTWHERTLVPLREQIARLEQTIRSRASDRDRGPIAEWQAMEWADELATIRKALAP